MWPEYGSLTHPGVKIRSLRAPSQNIELTLKAFEFIAE